MVCISKYILADSRPHPIPRHGRTVWIILVDEIWEDKYEKGKTKRGEMWKEKGRKLRLKGKINSKEAEIKAKRVHQVSSSPRNVKKGVNISRRFYESPRMIDNTIPRFAENFLQQHKRVSIYWRTTDSVVNPSRRFVESPRSFGIKCTNT